MKKFLNWLRCRIGARELVCVNYGHADRMIREDPSWRVAPEEDRNREIGMVWIERPARKG